MKTGIYNDPMPVASTNKVTVGFKCAPALKKKLAIVSSELGFTVSEFVESLLAEFTDLESYKRNNQQGEIIRELLTEKEILKNKLAFYECPLLISYFKNLQGKRFAFTDYNGKKIDITISRIQDVFNLIIHSFKIN